MNPIVPAAVYVAAALVLLASGAIAWRHRETRRVMALSLVVVAVGGSGWSLAAAVVVAGQGSTVAGIAALAAFPGAAVTVAGFVCLGRTVVGTSWVPTRGMLVGLSIEPVLVMIVAATNPWHLVLYRGPGATMAVTPELWVRGPAFWLHIAYCYVLLALGLAMVVRGWWQAPEVFRRQRLSLLVASTFPVLVNFTNLTGAFIGREDPTPLGFAATGAVMAYAVLRQDLVTLAPVARGTLIERIGDAVVALSPDGRIIDANPAAEALLRATTPDLPETLVGRAAAEAMHAWCDADGREVDIVHGSTSHLRLDVAGRSTDLEVRASRLTDRRGRAIGTVLVARDVTEVNAQRRCLEAQLTTIEQLRRDLAEQASRDSLTSLHNRRHLMEAFAPLLVEAASTGSSLAVVLVDLDHFKAVNDAHGHLVGDEVLVAMAERLRQVTPEDGLVARWGGEEFVLVLPGVDATGAVAVAESLRRCCAGSPFVTEGVERPCTISAGVAVHPRDGLTANELLDAADRALYDAKDHGRDTVRVHRGGRRDVGVGAWGSASG